MTVAEWLEQKGARKMLLKLLRARFGEVPDDAVARNGNGNGNGNRVCAARDDFRE